jgi:hypothetical protein
VREDEKKRRERERERERERDDKTVAYVKKERNTLVGITPCQSSSSAEQANSIHTP